MSATTANDINSAATRLDATRLDATCAKLQESEETDGAADNASASVHEWCPPDHDAAGP